MTQTHSTDTTYSSDQWKIIYLARRNPNLAAEEFPQAWREHSALGRQCLNVGQRVKSVAQCSRLLDAALPGVSQEYDGVNLLILTDREAARAIWSDPETLAIMKPDELRVFDRYVREFSMVCSEQVLQDMPRTDVVLYAFLRRRADFSAASFQLSWIAAKPGDQLLQESLNTARRVVHNLVVETPPIGYEYDVVVEWWFESEQELLHAVSQQEISTVITKPLAGLLDLQDSVFIATRVTHSRP